jgi:hypothetical protein
VLGEISDILREGYVKIEQFGTFGAVQETAFRHSLDAANSYAQELYAIYAGATPDLYGEEISTVNAVRIAKALETSREILRLIEVALQKEQWDIAGRLQAALDKAQRAIEWTAALLGKAAAAAVTPLFWAFWPILLVAAVALFVYLKWGRKLLRGGA